MHKWIFKLFFNSLRNLMVLYGSFAFAQDDLGGELKMIKEKLKITAGENEDAYFSYGLLSFFA